MNTKLILTQKAYQQLKYFTQLSKHEISGIGKSNLKINDKGLVEEIIVKDIIIFKQECSAAGTIIEDGTQEKFFYELTKKKDATKKDWNIWWHSHAIMDTFWSTTDEKTIANHAGLQPYLISLVTNKAGDYLARLDIFPKDTSVFKKNCYIKYDLDIEVEEMKENKILEQQKEKIERIILNIEEQKEKTITALDKALDDAGAKLIRIEELKEENLTTKKQCEKEIKNKVTERMSVIHDFNTEYRWKNYNNPNFEKVEKWNWWDTYNEKPLKKIRTKTRSVNQMALMEDPYYYDDNPDWSNFKNLSKEKEEKGWNT